ncbi:MAG: hypothetical protein QW327_05675 [Candidatus Odinarchaeota archaeon]
MFKRSKSPKEGYTLTRLCPVCGSDKLREFNALSGWYTQLQYICEECGYSGTLYLEVEVKKSDLNSSGNSKPARREDNL